jgi:hypothetical protein
MPFHWLNPLPAAEYALLPFKTCHHPVRACTDEESTDVIPIMRGVRRGPGAERADNNVFDPIAVKEAKARDPSRGFVIGDDVLVQPDKLGTTSPCTVLVFC